MKTLGRPVRRVELDQVLEACRALRLDDEVAGIGTASFTVPTVVRDDDGAFDMFSLFACTNATGGPDIFSLIDPAFNSYDLSSSIGPVGPVTGENLELNPLYSFATTGGNLNLQAGHDATFQASVVPRPPPSLSAGSPGSRAWSSPGSAAAGPPDRPGRPCAAPDRLRSSEAPGSSPGAFSLGGPGWSRRLGGR
jgi:hypothetical protein